MAQVSVLRRRARAFQASSVEGKRRLPSKLCDRLFDRVPDPLLDGPIWRGDPPQPGSARRNDRAVVLTMEDVWFTMAPQ